jgi:hypothetical protein
MAKVRAALIIIDNITFSNLFTALVHTKTSLKTQTKQAKYFY